MRGKGKHGLLWAVRMSASSRLSDGRQGIQKNMPESVQYLLRKLRDSTRNIELRGARVRFGDCSFGDRGNNQFISPNLHNFQV